MTGFTVASFLVFRQNRCCIFLFTVYWQAKRYCLKSYVAMAKVFNNLYKTLESHKLTSRSEICI